jgi:hypothetical protein
MTPLQDSPTSITHALWQCRPTVRGKPELGLGFDSHWRHSLPIVQPVVTYKYFVMHTAQEWNRGENMDRNDRQKYEKIRFGPSGIRCSVGSQIGNKVSDESVASTFTIVLLYREGHKLFPIPWQRKKEKKNWSLTSIQVNTPWETYRNPQM